MQRSFTQPRPKHLASWDVKVLSIFFSTIIVLVISAWIFLQAKIYFFQDSIVEAAITKTRLEANMVEMQKQIDYIKVEANKAKVIFTNNALLASSIQNLFDIVPNEITLTKAVLEDKKLVLYGRTPSKDIYQFRLLAPLRSIFDKTFTSFHQLRSGWYNFVSTNIMVEKVVETVQGETYE